jgi:hypothetical protein
MKHVDTSTYTFTLCAKEHKALHTNTHTHTIYIYIYQHSGHYTNTAVGLQTPHVKHEPFQMYAKIDICSINLKKADFRLELM